MPLAGIAGIRGAAEIGKGEQTSISLHWSGRNPLEAAVILMTTSGCYGSDRSPHPQLASLYLLMKLSVRPASSDSVQRIRGDAFVLFGSRFQNGLPPDVFHKP